MIESIDRERCIGCGACVARCPIDTLRLGPDGKARIAYPDECMTCFVCERSCPVGAIFVSPIKEVLAPAFGPDLREPAARGAFGACSPEGRTVV